MEETGSGFGGEGVGAGAGCHSGVTGDGLADDVEEVEEEREDAFSLITFT